MLFVPWGIKLLCSFLIVCCRLCASVQGVCALTGQSYYTDPISKNAWYGVGESHTGKKKKNLLTSEM